MEQLSPNERELLLHSVNISMTQIKRIARRIATEPTEEQRAHLVDQLQKNIIAELEAAKDNPQYHDKLCLRAKEHIAKWGKEFGPISLQEAMKIADRFCFSVTDIVERSLVTPKAIYECLKGYVFGQDEYLSKLSLAFYTHYLRTKYPEEFEMLQIPSLLVFGPTGSGKTYAIQVLARLFGIPFGIANCNAMVKTGTVGHSLPDVFTDIYQKHSSLDKVERSIILIDELDKVNEQIVNELLSLTDDNGRIQFNDSHGNKCFTSSVVSTKNMLFIYTGVFDSLRRAVEKRLGKGSVGFQASPAKQKDFCFYEYATLEDFNETNLKPEILGRIRDVVYVREHTTETLCSILLRGAESPLQSYRNYFEKHDIELTIDESGARTIAEVTMARHLGVRGLKTMLWKLLEGEMVDVTTKRSINITEEYVSNALTHGTRTL